MLAPASGHEIKMITGIVSSRCYHNSSCLFLQAISVRLGGGGAHFHLTLCSRLVLSCLFDLLYLPINLVKMLLILRCLQTFLHVCFTILGHENSGLHTSYYLLTSCKRTSSGQNLQQTCQTNLYFICFTKTPKRYDDKADL